MDIVIHDFKHAIMITFFVFVMMMLIDYINVLTKGKMNNFIKGSKFRQYSITSFLSATPGCLGVFMNVSFYIRGIISFGAILGAMIATSGDEAFIMLAMFPQKALLLFGILFVLGIFFAYITDKFLPVLKIKTSRKCKFSDIHKEDECRCLNLKEVITHIKKMTLVRFLLLIFLFGIFYSLITGIIGTHEWNWKRITFISLSALAGFIVITVPDHFLEEHIWNHIAKKHLWKIFLWSFSALLLVDIGLKFLNLETFIKSHMFYVLVISGLIAVIPESGPHIIFVMMFAKGIIPFSVLLTSSIVQDGHGMLPLLSYSIKDSMLIKLFNFIIGIGIGTILYLIGY